MHTTQGLNDPMKIMEKALKTVYDIHRQALLETSQKESKFKNLYERLSEKYKKLQRDHEVLFEQNKHLQVAAFNKQNRDGDCCAALRSTLATIGSSYKHLIDEREARIKQLEDEVRKYKRRSASLGVGSIDFSQASPSPSSRRATSHSPLRLNNDTSPDSTSRTGNSETGSFQTPQKTVTINKLESHDLPAQTDSQDKCDGDKEEDLLFVDKSGTSSHQPKLRLNKGKLKRSRYSEEISPENKRQRQSSSPKSNTCTSESSRKATSTTSKTSTSNEIARPVLVPDTCQHNLDETMLKLDDNMLQNADKDKTKVNRESYNAKKNNKMKSKDKENGFPGIQVVPETLAAFTEMDYSDTEDDAVDIDKADDVNRKPDAQETPNKSMDVVSDTDESGDDISQCTVKERNKRITELSMRSVLKSSDSQRNRSNLDEDIPDFSSPARNKKVRGKSGGSKRENNRTLEESTCNILDSPQSQSFTLGADNDDDNVGEYINHKTLNLSGESEVFELESDNEQNKELNDKVDKENKEESGDKRSGYESDELLAGKSRKDKLLEDSQVSLRRSPRKLKEVQYYSSPKKSKKRLNEKSQLTESEIHEMFSSPGSNDEGDLTVQPTTPVIGHKKCETLETQSMDCFNIVPVKDGVPISVKKFQLKVPKNKRRGEKNQNLGSGKEMHLEEGDAGEQETDKLSVDNMQSADLKSPSIISHKPIVIDKTPEVCIVSSPSVGSLTDPESPLLLQQKKDNSKSEKSRKNTDDHNSSWLKSRNNKSTGEDPDMMNKVNEKNKTNSPVGTRKSSRIKPSKSMCQTTLTQSFLRSPPRKGQKAKGKVKDTDIDHDLEEAIRLSLEEAANSQPEEEHVNDDDIEVLDFGTEKENSPPFKRPRNLPRASLRRRNKSSNADTTKTSVQKPESNVRGGVLKEIPDTDNVPVNQRFGSEEVGLNGSVDPAAEITALCAESGSLETLPSLDKDFQFEDLHQGTSLPKTSTLAEEDSQEIASSSRSVTFGTKKKKKHVKTTSVPEEEPNIQQVKPTEVGFSFDTSFDHVPKKNKGPEIAHVEVVRKRDERQKLKGHSCRECYEYYKSKGLPEEEIQKQIQDCSRHRAKHMKPDTPPHFWSVGFIDTQECVDRGHMQIENKEKDKEIKSYRRRVPLNKNFKAKNEVSLVDSDISDLED